MVRSNHNYINYPREKQTKIHNINSISLVEFVKEHFVISQMDLITNKFT